MNDLRITLIQSTLHWENGRENLEMFSKKIDAIVEPTDIIILPEMFNTGFTMNAAPMAEKMDGPTISWMRGQAARKNCVVTGSVIIEEAGKYYNRLVWMSPGEMQTYDKRHLFSLAGEQKVFNAGNKNILPEVNGWRILPLICYDLRFPVWSRRTTRQDYDLIIYEANWPERRVQAWSQLLIGRAIENQCYVAGVNRVGNDGNEVYYSGESAVIDFKGDKIGAIGSEEGYIHCNLNYDALALFRRQLAFFKDGDEFEIKGT